MIGDLDPIKAARAGLELADELTMHYGLLPRANRGIFAINELPDLAGKIQVGLFNILQEGDVQIKGYPVRLPLDVMMVFSANPEDYTARGKIITPLKDRIGSEIRTHYPATAPARDGDHRAGGLARCAADGRRRRAGVRPRGRSRRSRSRRGRIRRSTSARASASGCRSRCSRTSSRTPSGARCSPASRRSCRAITDIYAALPAITGKFELEYEGELRGADNVARDIIRAAVGNVFNGYFAERGSAAGDRVVRPRRHAAGRRHAAAPRSCSRAPREVQGLQRAARRTPASARRRRRRCSPRPSTSCSKGCTRRRRSAAPTSGSIRAPSSRAGARARPSRERCRRREQEVLQLTSTPATTPNCQRRELKTEWSYELANWDRSWTDSR